MSPPIGVRLPAARQASEEMNTPCTQSFNHRTSPLLTTIQHIPNIPLDIWVTFHGISNRLTLPVIVSPPMQTRQRMSRGAGSHVSVISRSGSPNIPLASIDTTRAHKLRWNCTSLAPEITQYPTYPTAPGYREASGVLHCTLQPLVSRPGLKR